MLAQFCAFYAIFLRRMPTIFFMIPNVLGPEPIPIKIVESKSLLYSGIALSQNHEKGRVSDMIGQFQRRLKFYTKICL